MTPLDFREIAELVNKSRTTRIDLQPARYHQDNWALYNGQYRVHTSTYPFKVLYLGSSATKESIERAAREAFNPDDTQVVYAPSLNQRHKIHHERFGRYAQAFWTTQQYLASFIKEELDVYLSKLQALTTEFYIDPRVETPSGFKVKHPNPVWSLLVDEDPGGGSRQGMLGIVLAEPGQGKTYMSYDLVSTLCKHNIVPIYINSAQWRTMLVDDLRDLWKTITHSFRYFEAPIGWLEGIEEKFLQVTLKAGIFKIIFDGFDEYLLWNRGQIQALDVLEALADLVEDTGARIVITSRTSFWQLHVPENEAKEFVERTRSPIYTILPFDEPNARNYFAKRFKKQELIDRAVSIFRAVQKYGHELVGRGFVLKLVADLVEQPNIDIPPFQSASNAVELLLRALCERETLRQQLPIRGSEQMKALRLFAAEATQGEEPTTEMMKLSINVTAPHLEPEALDDCIEKFKSHPLITKAPLEDVWQWAQEQVEIVLLASHVLALAKGPDSNARLLSEFLNRANLAGGRGTDLAVTTVDLLLHGVHGREVEQAMRSFVATLLTAGDLSSDSARRWSMGRRLAVTISLIAVDRLVPSGSSRQERAELLARICQGPPLQELPFSGTIARMDLRGVTFERCRFERVTWANCRFDETTIFKDCHFIGGNSTNCETFGAAQWDACITDQEATAWINALQINEGRRRYSVEDLRADMRLIIDKFLGRGGIGFKAVEAGNLSKGPIKASRYRDEVIAELCATVLEEHEISGRSGKGYHVRETAKDAVSFYSQNNVFTGSLLLTFNRLQSRLGLH